MSDWKEAIVVINGHTLTMQESMTLRVALGVFSIYISGNEPSPLNKNYSQKVIKICEYLNDEESRTRAEVGF